jgi:hypothetical protein
MVGHGRTLAATGLHQFLALACTLAAGPLATDAQKAPTRRASGAVAPAASS